MNTSYKKDEVDINYRMGFDTGYDVGNRAGYDVGYEEGFFDGCKTGYEKVLKEIENYCGNLKEKNK